MKALTRDEAIVALREFVGDALDDSRVDRVYLSALAAADDETTVRDVLKAIIKED